MAPLLTGLLRSAHCWVMYCSSPHGGLSLLLDSSLPPLPTLPGWPVAPAAGPAATPSRCFAFQELKQLVLRMGQEARAHQRAREHEAERLRIEIVTLREALEEETAGRASLEGQLRVQREEAGERRDALPRDHLVPGGEEMVRE